MTSEYQKQFMLFLTEVKAIADARDATYELSKDASNLVILSGSIIGKETNEMINEIGQRYGLLVLANKLTVLFRDSEIE